MTRLVWDRSFESTDPTEEGKHFEKEQAFDGGKGNRERRKKGGKVVEMNADGRINDR